MLKSPPSPWLYFAQLLSILGLLAFAYYLELFRGIAPCALCEVQRMVFGLLGALFLTGTFFRLSKKGHIVLNGFISLVALLGVLLASRHVWLQYAPPEAMPVNSTCGVSIAYLLKVMPFADVVLNVLLGGPECAKITWEFLHLSIAEWSLVWFVAFMLIAWKQILSSYRALNKGK